MAVSAEKRSSRVRRQASKKQLKNRTVQVRFSDGGACCFGCGLREHGHDPLRRAAAGRTGEGAGLTQCTW